MGLLRQIARCPNVRHCLENPDAEHPCHEIVLSQSIRVLNEFQLPEPWSGPLAEARILFLGSNPSIGHTGDYPNWGWKDYEITDFFDNRFGGGRKEWIKKMRFGLNRDGSHKRSTFWAAIRQRARELLGRKPHPGDYALSDVVHCKSKEQRGVGPALKECSGRYLKRVVEMSGAKVIVVLGNEAKRRMVHLYGMDGDRRVQGPITIGGRKRYVAFLPHTNARGPRTFARLLRVQEMEKLCSFLRP